MTDHLPMTIPAAITPAQRTSLVNLVRRAARTEILPRFRDLSMVRIEQKTGPQDLVTEADQQAEKMIARGLRQLFPDALVVGEEDVAANPGLVGKIADAPLAFTIDPVHGTWNFAHGLTQFGVILSATRHGTPVFGLLYDPITDDAILADTTGPALSIRPWRARRTLTVSAGGEIGDLTGYVGLYMLDSDRQAAMAGPSRSSNASARCAAPAMNSGCWRRVMYAVNVTAWLSRAGLLDELTLVVVAYCTSVTLIVNCLSTVCPPLSVARTRML